MAHVGNRGQQRLRVQMHRIVKYRAYRCDFRDPPGVRHHHSLCQFSDDAEVVRVGVGPAGSRWNFHLFQQLDCPPARRRLAHTTAPAVKERPRVSRAKLGPTSRKVARSQPSSGPLAGRALSKVLTGIDNDVEHVHHDTDH